MIPLPYSILQAVPFVDWGRIPGRIILLAMMSLSVLVALGTDWIIDRINGTSMRLLVVIFITLLALLDHLFIWPWPAGEAIVPEFYCDLAGRDEEVAILDLPLWDYRCERYQLYYATVHNHPIVWGLITRRSP